MDEKLLIGHIDGLLREKEKIIIGIDGRCGSGKTTLAASLSVHYNCPVFHTDDYFLPPEMRTPERLSEPGGNMHRERFKSEIVAGILSGKAFIYRAFSCEDGSLTDVNAEAANISIIEGTYSAHPGMDIPYDFLIFCDVDPEEQMRRIIARNGEKMAEMFRTKWIPLEETYFDHFRIREKADIIVFPGV